MKTKVLILGLCALLLSCHHDTDKKMLMVGSISGPETELVEAARDVAASQGLPVKIVEFNDYNLPNEALADESIDMNIYQHQPYLDKALRAKHYAFTVLGKTFVYPMGLYSLKHKTLSAIPEGAVIALPNDPSNEERALILLAKGKMITLRPGHGTTVHRIRDNPKHIVFKEMDAAQLPRVLPDVDGAVINTTFAIPAGLHPSKDALLVEGSDSPYANLIVVRKVNDIQKEAAMKKFVKAMHSEAVKKKAQSLFGDAAVPAW